MDEKTNQNNTTDPAPDKKSAKSQKSAMRWILPLILVALIVNVFMQKEKPTIGWVEDYDAGFELAKQQNKPVLLIFFKHNTGYANAAWDGAYTNPKVIEYVDKNFVTIFIDIDKKPDLAEQYKIDYYPKLHIQQTKDGEILGTLIGYDPPSLFIEKLQLVLDKIKE